MVREKLFRAEQILHPNYGWCDVLLTIVWPFGITSCQWYSHITTSVSPHLCSRLHSYIIICSWPPPSPLTLRNTVVCTVCFTVERYFNNIIKLLADSCFQPVKFKHSRTMYYYCFNYATVILPTIRIFLFPVNSVRFFYYYCIFFSGSTVH